MPKCNYNHGCPVYAQEKYGRFEKVAVWYVFGIYSYCSFSVHCCFFSAVHVFYFPLTDYLFIIIVMLVTDINLLPCVIS